MAKKREKKTVYTGITSEQMEQAFADYAKADARQQKITAEMDIQMAIPTILMAIVISSVLGPGLFNLMVAVGITYIPKFARLTRASVLSIKDQEFIEAARAMGASHKRIICLYILPNCAAPLIVQSTLSVANAILFFASEESAYITGSVLEITGGLA